MDSTCLESDAITDEALAEFESNGEFMPADRDPHVPCAMWCLYCGEYWCRPSRYGTWFEYPSPYLEDLATETPERVAMWVALRLRAC